MLRLQNAYRLARMERKEKTVHTTQNDSGANNVPRLLPGRIRIWGRFGLASIAALLILAVPQKSCAQTPTGTQHSVTLTWSAPSPVGGSGTISGYNVYRATGTGSSVTYAKLNGAVVPTLTYVDQTVTAGAIFQYCVSTVDSLNEESACSTPATANIPTNPNAPASATIIITIK
jgi:hypothetical protein